ncbi:MAG TPA: hypothetical protein ENH53_09035, partial [Bacteroidetes bacterium]|nr:hypothetical protein [Bacteroidota bacterium]
MAFYRGQQPIFRYSGQSPDERIVSLFGDSYRENIIPVDFKFSGIHVTGFVGNTDLFRAARGGQYLFLNRRFIVNKSLNYAVSLAYGTMLPRGNFPFYVLNLTLNPEEVDVNVHPSKIEVRFEDERLVFRSVLNGVKEALNSAGVVPVLRAPEAPIETFESPAGPSASGSRHPDFNQNDLHFPFEFRQTRRDIQPENLPAEPAAVSPEGRTPESEPENGGGAAGRSQVNRQLYKASRGERVTVWQLHNKYIFSQIKSGLIIIDQHLAHERILFERAMENLNKRPPTSQQLLFPRTVELSAEDFEILKEIQYYLSQLGFIVKDFGGRTVVIEAVPTDVRGDEETILRQIIDDYKNLNEQDIREKVAAAFACKSAIKAGDPLTRDGMIALIDGLFATKNPYFCPHGRPVIVTIPLEELDKRFLRL